MGAWKPLDSLPWDVEATGVMGKDGGLWGTYLRFPAAPSSLYSSHGYHLSPKNTSAEGDLAGESVILATCAFYQRIERVPGRTVSEYQMQELFRMGQGWGQ